MPSDNLINSLQGIGIRTPQEALAALLAHAQKSRLGPVQTLEQLVLVEQRTRDAANLVARDRAAHLGVVTPLDRFDWAHPRQIDRVLYERLLTLDFVDRGENVLLRGQSGVGKTQLAQCLGLAALERGYSVRFGSLAAALADLLKQESLPALERRLRHYLRPSLLIIDEIGYLPCDTRAADLLFNIVSRRHEHRSIVVTTNLSFKQWGTVFPGAACLVALVDRFAQHCHVVDIDADSWRDTHRKVHSPSDEPSPLKPAPRRPAAKKR